MHLESTVLPGWSVRPESGGIDSHASLLRQGRLALSVGAYRVGLPPLYGCRPCGPATDSGPEVPGLLAGRNQGPGAMRTAESARRAGAAKGNDARKADAARQHHSGDRKDGEDAAQR